MKALDPLESFPKIKAQNLRIQNVRRDGHMPDAAQEKLEAAAPETAEINQYGDAAALVPAAANGRLLDWIKGRLKPEGNQQLAAEKGQRIHIYPAKMPAGSPLGDPH